MKKFSYKLEPVLRVKHFREKRLMLEYSKVAGKMEAFRNQIYESDQLIKKHSDDASRVMAGKVFDLQEEKLLRSYYTELQKKKEMAKEQISGYEEEFNRQKSIIENARRERRLLEILREKKYEQYRIEMQREEMKMLDEFNANRRGNHVSGKTKR